MLSSKSSSFSHNTSLSEITVTSVMNNSSVISVPEGCVTMQFFPFVPWDNEDNIVPKEVDNIFNLMFTGICLPMLFIVSFCTNIINMVVFYKHGLKERINACLFTLSLVDLFSISVAFAYSSDVLYMFVIGKGGENGLAPRFFIDKYLIGLHGFQTASQMVYSVIAVERCLCVTRPLLVKSFMSTKTTVVALWTMVLVITGSCVFVGWVIYDMVCVFHPTDSSVSYIIYPSPIYFRFKNIIDILYSVLLGAIFSGLIFLCVTVCTIVTAVELKKLSQWRKTVSSASESVSSRDVAITRVIIGTSILFTLCMLPSLVMYISLIIVPDLGIGGRYDNLSWIIKRFYQLATAVNNTFNFFIYYVYGSKFRETTHDLFPFSNRDGTQPRTF